VPQIVPLRGLIVQHHLIICDDGVDLIDGGFMGGIDRIQKALRKHGKTLSDVRSILLTHGHLDHTLNVAKLKKLTTCRVYAPRADRDHVMGRHQYCGWARVAGWLEGMGRFLFRFETPEIDHWFEPGERIHGLEVIALPGHTAGHCGFLQSETGLLFAGDLFTDHFGKPSPPPAILNDDSAMARASIRTAAGLDLEGVMLNHARKSEPSQTLLSLIDLADDL
jgi:glyoxylase-like metal-dependent hydrolase (beta-lactamase superfamily II)